MSKYLTLAQVQEFLKDIELSSETSIVEDAKEKNELLAIAKARGYVVGKANDLGFVKNVYAFATIANKNKYRLNKKALLKALPTMIGKPINADHRRDMIIGHMIDYRYNSKDDKVISYGVVYRGNLPHIWAEIEKRHKAKKLATSYEVWCPPNKRNFRNDGTIELMEQEIVGDAILFNEKPAFEDAKMLALAKEDLKSMDKNLIYASKKYCSSEIIISSGKVPCIHCGKCNTVTAEEINEPEKKVETPKVEVPQPQSNKIKCSNCGHEFEKPLVPTSNMKCEKCFAILDNTGKMMYPPQIKDFKILCLSCKVDNWIILSKTEDKAQIKCSQCAKEYEIKFAKDNSEFFRNTFRTIYIGSISCVQCGHSIEYSGVSNATEKLLKCEKCGLKWRYDVSKSDKFKKISTIEEIPLHKSSEEGGNKMEFNIELTKFHRYIDVDNFDEIENASINEEYSDDFESAEKAKRMTYQERKGLSDKDFAVVVKVKNKKTGEMRKIRKYPINDEAHVRNALARLGQDKAKETLRKLGVSVEKVKVKVLQRAKKLGMTDLLERYKKTTIEKSKKVEVKKPEDLTEAQKKDLTLYELENKFVEKSKRLENGIKKLAKQLVEATKKIKKAEKKTEFYKKNGKTISDRRIELGKFADNLSDEDILNEDKYIDAKTKKEKVDKKPIATASDTVADKRDIENVDWITEFGRKVRKSSAYQNLK